MEDSFLEVKRGMQAKKSSNIERSFTTRARERVIFITRVN